MISWMPPRLGWLEEETMTSFLSSRVLVTKALRARLGPTSTKTRMPSAYMRSIWRIHWTGDAICRVTRSRTSFSSAG